MNQVVLFLFLSIGLNITSKAQTSNGDTLHIPDRDQIFIKVEQEASFPGGGKGWLKYLEKNLKATTPIDNGAKEGTYKVVISFIVSKDSSISNIIPETRFGHGMEQECVRIIKNSGKWVPAMQNGRVVNAYRRQPITFIVQED